MSNNSNNDLIAVTESLNQCFLDSNTNEAYIEVEIREGIYSCMRVESDIFTNYITQHLFKSGQSFSKQKVTQIKQILSAQAQFQQVKLPIHKRVFFNEKEMTITIHLKAGKYVVISQDSWKIQDRVDDKFYLSPSMKDLPEPKSPGNFKLIQSYINIPDEKQFTLYTANLLNAYYTNSPYTILVLSGEQGSSKSFTTKITNLILDPNVAPTRPLPKDELSIAIAAKNAHLIGFDNLSYIKQETSDCLCRMATGGGIGKKKLYTDDSESIINILNPIILNGIDELLKNADLADRCVPIQCPTITPDKRIRESELLSNFEKDYPHILAGFYDLLCVSLKNYNKVKLEENLRMADFVHIGTSIEKELGLMSGEFLNFYKENQLEKAIDYIESNFLLRHIISTILEYGPIEGSPTEVFKTLFPDPESKLIPKYDKSIPKTPASLTKAINRFSGTLRQFGFQVFTGRKDSKGRRVIVVAPDKGFDPRKLYYLFNTTVGNVANSPFSKIKDEQIRSRERFLDYPEHDSDSLSEL